MSELVYDFAAGFDDPADKNAWFDRRITPGSRILEVGCATGYVGEYLVRNRGCQVVGVEIVPQAAAKARERNAYASVITGDILDPSVIDRIADAPFDVVLFGDVLEHLLDPREALNAVATLLRPGGRILICVPNIVHWSIRTRVLAGRFDYTTHGILDRTHVRFYTPQTLRAMVAEADMRIEDSGGVIWLPGAVNRLPLRVRTWLAGLAERISPNLFYGQTLLQLTPREGRDAAG